ncbi:MAG TPA: hypothetical protein VFS19_00340, partial [Planctomycetota bacterium]|nr:hypothetical protein [Planctomycetota bacterium]
MKIVLLLALTPLLLTSVPAQEDEPCDMAKVEEGFWCLRCRKAKKAADLDKAGACAACGLAPEKTRLCFKSWVP